MTVMMTARKPGEMEGDKGTAEEGGGGRVGGRGGGRICWGQQGLTLCWRGWEVGRIFDEDASRVISEKLYGLYSVK